MKPKYLITNLVYGNVYSTLFLDQHLKSLLDETNLPELVERYDVHYLILTDDETLPVLQNDKNMKALAELLKINGTGRLEIVHFSWGEVADKFGRRYSGLLDLFKISVNKALQHKFDLLTTWVADLVVAKNFFSKIMDKIEAGHGAVFVQPPRAAAESIIEHLENFEGALPAQKLWKLCYEHMHPLWWACHWENPLFTKLPFQLIWNNNKNGVRVHSYSITPVIFKPNEKMLGDNVRGMIDGDIPDLCENPYWATDWTDAPVIGVEPLFCYYPTFENRPSSLELMHEWNHKVHPSQVKFLDRALYYPDEKTVGYVEVRDIPGQITRVFEAPEVPHSSVAEQTAVNRPVGGSNPSEAANEKMRPMNRAERRWAERQQRGK